ncbi:MAG: enoyl-CoA hydratase-related protein [Pseudomonadota bacterium]
MGFETIQIDISGGVATIRLDRPKVMNALNAQMRRDLVQALTQGAREARAIVLTGNGDAFCAGQDLGEGISFGDLDLERTLREEYEPLLKLIYDCPVPTVCAVNGAAAGAGANLALAADIVIAAKSATFLEAFARIGLVPDAGGTYWLPRLVGRARALGMCLLAEPVTAGQAMAWGLIWEAVDDEKLSARVGEIAQRLAVGPTVSHRLTKQAIAASFQNDLQAQLELEARLQKQAGTTRDFREGVMAFLEKRPARYEGR